MSNIAMQIKAAVARAEQLRAAHAAVIRVHITGEYPPPPEGISQPRWLAMIETVRNHFQEHKENKNGSTAWQT
jgi:hypothetical protein